MKLLTSISGKSIIFVSLSLIFVGCSDKILPAAPQALYDEYHDIVCKTMVDMNGSIELLNRQLELNTEFEDYAALPGHALKLAEAIDVSTCN